jgi:hypothetical protein
VTEFVDTGLAAASEYIYRVVGVGKAGSFEPSLCVKARTE